MILHVMPPRSPLLAQLGAVIRRLRNDRHWSRRELAGRAHVSERFLADIEVGRGNLSVLKLYDLAAALDTTPDALLLAPGDGRRTVALLGLRGAGKSSVGARLARQLGRPFVELDHSVEQTARLSLTEMFQMHGEAYYRRIEHEVLRGVMARSEPVVLATGGGVVSSQPSFDLLNAKAQTVWLRASPEDHWQRVLAQGDTRPMAGNDQAFLDLCSILAEREPLYRRARAVVDTSGKSIDEVCAELAVRFGAGVTA